MEDNKKVRKDNKKVRKDLEKRLKKLYKNLYEEFKIDKKTGILKKDPTLKFPTYPYVGAKYGSEGVPKILVIGLDIGSDEKKDGVKSFEERREDIGGEKNGKYNPHIAGTYILASSFLKKKFRFRKKLLGNNEK